MADSSCEHPGFNVNAEITRLEDTGGFYVDIRINCAECGIPMVFLGLPQGLDLNGAATGPFGIEGRFAIHPKGETVPEMPLGFQMRKTKGS